MQVSERLIRYQHYDRNALGWFDEDDAKFSMRIAALLNHSKIDEDCMVDAYYYDFSVIPQDIQNRLNLYGDVYLIFGITTEGEIISKWVDRWELDSDKTIVNGKVND